MSTLAIIAIVVGAIVLLVFIGGLVAVGRRDRRQADTYAEHVAAADQALEQARAADKGWDRSVMEEAAREALRAQRPAFEYDDLHLILVDDRPGTNQDRAHFVAMGADGEARVVLARHGDHWGAEGVD
jgi:hypothetical protein